MGNGGPGKREGNGAGPAQVDDTPRDAFDAALSFGPASDVHPCSLIVRDLLTMNAASFTWPGRRGVRRRFRGADPCRAAGMAYAASLLKKGIAATKPGEFRRLDIA